MHGVDTKCNPRTLNDKRVKACTNELRANVFAMEWVRVGSVAVRGREIFLDVRGLWYP